MSFPKRLASVNSLVDVPSFVVSEVPNSDPPPFNNDPAPPRFAAAPSPCDEADNPSVGVVAENDTSGSRPIEVESSPSDPID